MKAPKIMTVQAIDDRHLLVQFENAQRKKYDISPLLQKKMFLPLNNPAFFKSVQVDAGGYAILWNSEIDISEHELWVNGKDYG